MKEKEKSFDEIVQDLDKRIADGQSCLDSTRAIVEKLTGYNPAAPRSYGPLDYYKIGRKAAMDLMKELGVLE